MNNNQPYPNVGSPDFPAIEARGLERWAALSTFAASIDRQSEATEFTFNDGPPFANGLPHHGHLLPGYVKDGVPRYKTMRGHKVTRRFGWIVMVYLQKWRLKINCQ